MGFLGNLLRTVPKCYFVTMWIINVKITFFKSDFKETYFTAVNKQQQKLSVMSVLFVVTKI